MPKYENLSVEDLLDAFDAVVWYNDCGAIISEWEKLEPEDGTIRDEYYEHGYDPNTIDRLEPIWMIAVLLFGDYDTSPRSGWVEDVESFRKFCHRITQTDRGTLL